MKKLLLLPLMIHCSLYANELCHTYFIQHYNVKEFKDLSSLNTNTFKQLKARIKNEIVPRRKLNLIKQQYDLISDVFHAETEIAKRFIVANKLTEKEMQHAYRDLYAKLIKSYRLEINFIVNESQKLLSSVGIKTQVRFNKISDNVQVKYLEYVDEGSIGKGAQRIRKHMAKMDTKVVTFDFIQNMVSHSAGFSHAPTRRIDLGLGGIRNVILDNLLTMVARHEFKHGGFAKMRILGKDSIYHADYQSIKGLNLTAGNDSSYTHYMSAEELYNFVNNPLWASSRIRNIENFHIEDIIGDVNRINYYIRETNIIAKQTAELTEDFVTLLKNNSTDTSKISFAIADINRKPVMSINDAFSIAILDKEKGRLLHAYIPPELKDDVEMILRVKEKLFYKYHNKAQALMNEGKDAEVQLLIQWQGPYYLKIMK